MSKLTTKRYQHQEGYSCSRYKEGTTATPTTTEITHCGCLTVSTLSATLGSFLTYDECEYTIYTKRIADHE